MRALLSAIALALLVAATAVAAPVEGSGEVEMQALLDDDGSGRLFVNNTDGPWQWESCTPRLTDCSRMTGDRELSTRGVRPPAVFRVRSEGLVGISPEWRGRVEQIAPPTVTGTIRANEFVAPVPGRWARGWEAELSEMQLSACRTAGGKDCTSLTDSHYNRRGCSLTASLSASFVIPAEFAGQFLRIAERRLGAGPVARLDYAVGSPYGHPVWRRDRVTAVAVAGRIASRARGYPGECGPPVPGEGSISRRGLGFVRCSEDCRATLTAARAGRVVRAKRAIGVSRSGLFVGPPEQIALPPDTSARLGEGPIRVVLRIDGRLRAERVIDTGP
ncbi:MAG TPA: hypothetical protein VGV69_06645 [Solirubrobacterales bacterium]|nr:hypothetical protein [Solirubrobacterales bacterium]